MMLLAKGPFEHNVGTDTSCSKEYGEPQGQQVSEKLSFPDEQPRNGSRGAWKQAFDLPGSHPENCFLSNPSI
jgi:hypothetical protein